MTEKGYDYSHLKLYTQEDLDTIKAQVRVKANLEQFVIDENGETDINKIKAIAQFLETSIKNHSDSFPHDAAVASELMDTALKIFIRAMP